MRTSVKLVLMILLSTMTSFLYGQHGIGCMCSSCTRARQEGRAQAEAENARPYTFTYIEAPSRPSRYSLEQGIDIAIANVKSQGRLLNLKSVLEELNRMQAANDIELPYSYSTISKSTFRPSGKVKIRTKTRLSPDQAKKKVAFEQWVARKVDMAVKGLTVSSKVPVPSDYEKRDDFIKAYSEYRMRTADNKIIEQYSKKIGGLDEYRRAMRNEASEIWRQKEVRR